MLPNLRPGQLTPKPRRNLLDFLIKPSLFSSFVLFGVCAPLLAGLVTLGASQIDSLTLTKESESHEINKINLQIKSLRNPLLVETRLNWLLFLVLLPIVTGGLHVWRSDRRYHQEIVSAQRSTYQRLQVQYEIGLILTESDNLSESIPQIIQTLCIGLEYDICEFWGLDPELNRLKLVKAFNIPEMDIVELEQKTQKMNALSERIIPGKVLDEGVSLWVNSPEAKLNHQIKYPFNYHWTAEMPPELINEFQFNETFGFPAMGIGGALGVILLYGHCSRCNSAELAEMGNAIGKQIGQFIEQRHREENAKRQNWRALMASSLSLNLRTTSDLLTILDITAVEVRAFLKADRMVVFRLGQLDADVRTGEVAVQSIAPNIQSLRSLGCADTNAPVPGWMVDLAATKLAIDSVSESDLPPPFKAQLSGVQVQSLLSAPIVVDEQLWGMLIVHQCHCSRHWRSFEIDFVNQIADQVALAIARANSIIQQHQYQSQLESQNTALEIARREAESATQIKSAFLATMSHEIRTPMNAVIGMTELLLNTPLNSTQQDFAETIRSSGNNLLTLINDILDFSKLEAGEVQLEQIDFDLWAGIEEVIDLFAIQAQKKGLELIAHIDPNLPNQVLGDPTRLRQVLLNLVSNAIKFTEKGEVILSANLLPESSDYSDTQILFSVKDTGIGVPESAQSSLFDPFTQVDASTTRKYGGTGLGLTICRRLVELMGGEIGLQSHPGSGSKFWLTLPLPTSLSNAPQCFIIPPVWQSQPVLVAVDNPAIAQLLNDQLSAWNIPVAIATTNEAAMTKLQNAIQNNLPYQLVLIDHDLRQLGAIGLAKQIKVLPKFMAEVYTPQLVWVANMSQRAEVSHLKQMGFAGQLLKPIHRDHLYDCLNNLLGHPHPLGAEKTIKAEKPRDSVTKNPPSNQLKILLAEDSPVNRKVASHQLRTLGYQADYAGDGLEVLQLLAKQTYNLILMDCQMPNLDGYETTRKIRELESEKSHQTVIIALTANALSEDRERCLAAGMDDYLSKPIRMEQLGHLLKQWSDKLIDQHLDAAYLVSSQDS